MTTSMIHEYFQFFLDREKYFNLTMIGPERTRESRDLLALRNVCK